MEKDQEFWSFAAALETGTLQLKGQFMLGSNYTFLVDIHYKEQNYQAVYKPSQGERPLWDFPENSLAHREVAAYLVSEALGWCFVPLTILREDGPYGPGSLQHYIEYDPNYHYFTLTKEDKELLHPVAVFDLLCNNADRKGSHLIFDKTKMRKLWVIDHGLCFHEEEKLRTTIWDFAGQPIPGELLVDLEQFLADLTVTSNLHAELSLHLSPNEIDVLSSRARALISSGKFPLPPEDRRAFPYPPL